MNAIIDSSPRRGRSRWAGAARTSLLAVLALAAAGRPAGAAWPRDPANGNVPVCTQAADQIAPASASDGAGGAIIAWLDTRGGTADVYAQRVSAAGLPMWTAGGVAVSVATGNQSAPAIVPDGAGGAIVAWEDTRGGLSDVYAQRINAAGFPMWTANGVALCTAAGDQRFVALASDSAGGAIVTWQDLRGGSTADIYAQRVSAAGAPLWTANGVALCTAAGDQRGPAIAPEGSGGAVVTWYDFRSGTTYDIYAQRISLAGVPQWTANGVAVCTAAGSQTGPVIVADGSGGADIAWPDSRGGAGNDIYAQRLNAAGAAQWTANGVSVCAATGEQNSPVIATDGSGGAIIAWQDARTGPYDIYAMHLLAAGMPAWNLDGVVVCSAPLGQYFPVIATDAAGGAIVAWQDYRDGATSDLYAQHMSSLGARQWATDGVALCTAPGNQYNTPILADGSGGAIVAWQDYRGGAAADIYAQRIERYGQLGNPEPVIRSVRDVPGDQGGHVVVSWDASYLDADPVYGVLEYRVFRYLPGEPSPNLVLQRGITSDPAAATRDGKLLAMGRNGALSVLDVVGIVPAEAFAGYSLVAPTASDSIAGANPATEFFVMALGTVAGNWTSAADSGYSVDNLAPATPTGFTGEYGAGSTRLHWLRNHEPDLAGYRVYRGLSGSFVPGPANLVASPPDTGDVDAASRSYVYKLTAVDVHGNPSAPATLVPSGTTAVGDGPDAALMLAPPSPNPTRGTTAIEYTLTRAGAVRLEVYDAAGRRVQVVRTGECGAGTHRENVALLDAQGHALNSGLYLVRLEAEGRVLTRRLVTVR